MPNFNATKNSIRLGTTGDILRSQLFFKFSDKGFLLLYVCLHMCVWGVCVCVCVWSVCQACVRGVWKCVYFRPSLCTHLSETENLSPGGGKKVALLLSATLGKALTLQITRGEWGSIWNCGVMSLNSPYIEEEEFSGFFFHALHTHTLSSCLDLKK